MEPVDQQLHDEDEQEHRRDLEEAREVDPVPVTRPQPGDERGEDRAADRAGDDLRRLAR